VVIASIACSFGKNPIIGGKPAREIRRREMVFLVWFEILDMLG
jgi:hypothetical protein